MALDGSLSPGSLILKIGWVSERQRVREIDDDEGRRLVRIMPGSAAEDGNTAYGIRKECITGSRILQSSRQRTAGQGSGSARLPGSHSPPSEDPHVPSGHTGQRCPAGLSRGPGGQWPWLVVRDAASQACLGLFAWQIGPIPRAVSSAAGSGQTAGPNASGGRARGGRGGRGGPSGFWSFPPSPGCASSSLTRWPATAIR